MIVEALRAGRAAADRLMVDTCTVRHLIRTENLDDDTGEYGLVPDPDLPDPVYSGPCKLTIGAVQVRDVDSQGQDLAVADATLAVPVNVATAAIGKDHTAVVTLTGYDTATVTCVVQAGHAQTYATARRLPVQIIT